MLHFKTMAAFADFKLGNNARATEIKVNEVETYQARKKTKPSGNMVLKAWNKVLDPRVQQYRNPIIGGATPTTNTPTAKAQAGYILLVGCLILGFYCTSKNLLVN